LLLLQAQQHRERRIWINAAFTLSLGGLGPQNAFLARPAFTA
jgi:hypothetical protein